MLNHLGIGTGNVEVHVFLGLTASRVLNVARATPLDLHTAPGLLLDVLYISASMTDYLGAKVEARDRVKVDRDLLLGPFPLVRASATDEVR